jgi:hypothetical protein
MAEMSHTEKIVSWFLVGLVVLLLLAGLIFIIFCLSAPVIATMFISTKILGVVLSAMLLIGHICLFSLLALKDEPFKVCNMMARLLADCYLSLSCYFSTTHDNVATAIPIADSLYASTTPETLETTCQARKWWELDFT